MNKGIVMEISDSSIIVMDPEGRFEKLPRGTRSCEIGEEILFAPVRRRFRVPQIAILSGLTAAIVMCFVLVSTLTGGVASGQVVAYVTIDINPSIEIGIDNDEIVQDLTGLNTDGDELISTLEYKGKPLADVTSDILERAEQGALGTGEGDIIISSTIVETRANVDDEAIATKLKAQVSKHIEEAHPDQVDHYAVTAFAAPQEVRQEAKASGVSAGKYAVYLSAVNNGAKVSLDDIKSVSIHQLAKENGGLDKLVTPSKPIDKSSLSKLVAEEKSGKLSERVQQLQRDKDNNKDNSKDNKDNSKDNDKGSSGNDKNAKSTSKPGKGETVNSKVSFKPTPTPTPKSVRNDNKNDNKNDDKNDNKYGNSRNGWDDRNEDGNDRNDKNDNDDKKPTPKPGKDDDDSKNGSSSKPRETPKPSVKPTSSSKPTAKPTVKPSEKPTAKPTVKPTATPKNDRPSNFNWNWGSRDWDSKKDNDNDR